MSLAGTEGRGVRGWASAWGVIGVSLLFTQAIIRLAPYAWELRVVDAPVWFWPLLAFWVLTNLYTEGYRAFQLKFSPRVVARARALDHEPRLLPRLLAPAVAMGLLWAPRRRLIASWVFLILLIALIIWVRSLPQPWRGFVDAGVVPPLAWGIVTLWYGYFRGPSAESASAAPAQPGKS